MKHHILVVDDDSEIRETIVEALRDRGYEALGAGDGVEALDTLRSRSPWCLILLDLMMPIMDGWQMRKEQLADPNLSTIPVVVVSATTDVTQAATTLHAVDYVTKPARLNQLLEAVERYCSN
ncbi:MAG: response regulator [Kofleriaceae bacterium]